MSNTYFSKDDLTKLFETMSSQCALVIGDVMVDSYLWGRVDRISPEAPVPVVNVHKRLSRLGGAANVALNIKSMGAKPILCSVCGNDIRGNEFLDLMQAENISTEGIIQSKARITTTKFRIIGNNTQMLRVDEENDQPLENDLADLLLERIYKLIALHKPGLIIFEDYDKGVITPYMIENIVAIANSNAIPVSADPKKRNFGAYRNISLFKPNLKELKEGTKTYDLKPDSSNLDDVLLDLRNSQSLKMVLLTLSESGIMISYDDKVSHIPSIVRSVADVSGAGDTVISVAALAQASGAEPEVVAALANLAGGLVCEHVGVVPVDRNELLKQTALYFGL